MGLENISMLMWVIIAVAGILGVAFLATKGKTVANINKYIVGFVTLGIGVALLVTQGGLIDLGGSTPTPTLTISEPTSSGDTTRIICAKEDTTVTLSAQDRFTSIASGGTHRYRLNGAPALTVADANTLTANPSDELEILWGNASTTAAYFSAVSKEIVPCSGAHTFYTTTVRNGTVTIDVFNRDGNLINGNDVNQTFASGDTFTLNARLTGTYQRGYPYGGIIIAEYNNTDFDDVIVNFGGQKTGVPDFFTVTNTANVAKAYTVPALLSNAELSGTVFLDAKDVNPGNLNDPVIRFYPSNYYINDDTGGSFEGPNVEDEDNVRTYDHTTPFTISIN